MGLIYLDACLLIYLAERHARWGGSVADAIGRAERARFGISPLVKCECLVRPMRRGDPVLERTYIELFEVFVSPAMPEPVYLQAAQLRARFVLRAPDALHLACAQHHSLRGAADERQPSSAGITRARSQCFEMTFGEFPAGRINSQLGRINSLLARISSLFARLGNSPNE